MGRVPRPARVSAPRHVHLVTVGSLGRLGGLAQCHRGQDGGRRHGRCVSCDRICIKVRTRTRARQQEGGAACNQTAQEVTRGTSHVSRDTTRVQVDVTDLEPRMLEPVAGGGLAVAGLSPWLAAIIAVLGTVKLQLDST